MSTDPENSTIANIYQQLADYLAEQLPAGLWIDLDQGQLEPENEDKEYPLPFDAGVLLIDFEDIDWQDRGQGVQRGTAVLKFTLAREVAQDSYHHSSQRAAALEKLNLLSQVHKALNHHSGAAFGALVRTNSRKEQVNPGLWVFSMSYKCEVTDADGYNGGGSDLEAVNVDCAPQGEFIIQL